MLIKLYQLTIKGSPLYTCSLGQSFIVSFIILVKQSCKIYESDLAEGKYSDLNYSTYTTRKSVLKG